MKVNIVSVWTWFANILDTQTLSASEQLILVHLIKIFNRNFWKPTKISTSAICRSSGKDARTVKRSIALLKSSGYVLETAEGLQLNIMAETENKRGEKVRKTRTQPRSSQPTTAGFMKDLNGVLDEGKGTLERELEEGKLSDKSKELLKGLTPELRDKILEKYKGIPLDF